MHNKKNRAALDSVGIISDRRQLYWISKNIEAGAYILAHYKKQCKGDIYCMLKRYSGSKWYVNSFKRQIGAYYIGEVVAER